MSSKKVLVAYSDTFLLEPFIELLEEEGYRVFATGNKKKALQILKEEQPDCLVTGVGLAFNDGENLISITQQLYPKVKIIVTSTRPEGDEKKYRKISIPYLAIPHRPDKLFKLLKKLL